MDEAIAVLDAIDRMGKELVDFHTPHSGFAGAAIRFPEPLRIVADSLAGTRNTVENAIQLFTEAAKVLVDDGICDSVEFTAFAPHVYLDSYIGAFITMRNAYMGGMHIQHSFCAIKFNQVAR